MICAFFLWLKNKDCSFIIWHYTLMTENYCLIIIKQR